ncbi:MAG: hypothetical protein INF43_04790 [Alphaproteobacteria bacterium]|jgi:hypothetical protein|nr:hypothetical protein [Alphaproteobacteria bacterium]
MSAPLKKPLKNIINQYEIVRIGWDLFFLKGIAADGTVIETSKVVALTPPKDGLPGLAETLNSYYALGEPKADQVSMTRSRTR